MLTITPGQTPTHAPYDPAPVAASVAVAGSNVPSLSFGVSVMTYGSIYQGGYVFALNDAYGDSPAAGSVGGTVASLTDRVSPTTGILWSADSTGIYDGGVSIYAIDQASTTVVPSPDTTYTDPTVRYTGQQACNGGVDGPCNSANILNYYGANAMTPVPPAFYAAGTCTATDAGYSDWHLPAICEMGPASNGTACAASQQNMLSSLTQLTANTCTGTSCLAGSYWSSSESRPAPMLYAWQQTFDPNGVSAQYDDAKANLHGVRCERTLTP